ncbi:ABC-2 type transport system ATP-binding protein [Rhodobium orientis]|uniref:ABC transporter n=1 Tax=Rhodobium orientis TaxID=34017 RepID=A0A327JMY5_9HYPH|nr:ABC transporter ATP-binding protein [Rhodobium orientis]MBB4304617.1 ABC-2 type transport system ATP-binding protein [Rhodobium orientis]MBK5949992.1 ABC transporter [Rhodobium orientis]RAI27687.1 ABC transporter [Rhodobium orientis]
MIRIEDISKTFRRRRVLDALSLAIHETDRIALIGANGAGKTTMIRCLLGEYVHAGTITVSGHRPRKDRREVLSEIGFVPQLPPPLKMPVGELIRFSSKVCHTTVDRIGGVADRLGLDLSEVDSRPFYKLSGGQKQKILVAIALGRDSKLLVFDEPTANLDPQARRALFSLISERLDEPMIISSHRLEEISGLVNRVVELDRGKVVLDDRVADAGDISEIQACEIELIQPDGAFERAIADWQFASPDGGATWTGEIAGPDRIRFLGLMTRYAGLIRSVHLKAAPNAASAQAGSIQGDPSQGDAHV